MRLAQKIKSTSSTGIGSKHGCCHLVNPHKLVSSLISAQAARTPSLDSKRGVRGAQLSLVRPSLACPSSSSSSVTSVLAPGPNYENVANVGAAKAAMPPWKILLAGILAGIFISYGGFLALSLGGRIPGIAAANPGLQSLAMGLAFPVGLMIVTICGAELFMGNAAVVSVALYEGRASLPQFLKSLCLSFLGNWIGSYLLAAAVAASGTMSANSLPIAITLAKTSLDFQTNFIRGVLCNWLVCSGVWMAASTSSLVGKVLACWVPITTFVCIGLDNSIANMFYLALGINLGAEVTYSQLWTSNIIPVALGNLFAGMFCMALPYALLFGSLGKKVQAALHPSSTPS